MSVRSRTMRRRVPRRAASAPAGPGDYQRSRAVVGLAIFILVFGFLWLVNGSFTADFVVTQLHGSVMWGWSLHFIMSAIEVSPIFISPFLRGIPKPIRVTIWLMSLPFGVLDVLSSAIGIQPFFLWTGAGDLAQHVQNTGLAEIVAFAPEPMIIWLLIALRNALRS